MDSINPEKVSRRRKRLRMIDGASAAPSACRLVDLPQEVLIRIILFACESPREIVTISLVCTKFYNITNDDELVWRPACEMKFRVINSSTFEQSGSWKNLFRHKAMIENFPWSIKPKTPASTIHNNLLGITSMAINDKFIACGGGTFEEPFEMCALFVEKTVNIYDKSTLQLIEPVRCYMGSIMDVQLHSKYMMAGGTGGKARVWKYSEETRTFEFRRTFKGHDRTISSLQFNRRHLFTASRDSTVRLWDFRTAVHLRTLAGHTKQVNNIHYNRHYLISASHDKTARVWDVETGKCRQVFYDKDPLLTSKIDENLALTAGESKTKLWDLRSGLLVRKYATPISFPPPWITSLQFDENKIIGGGFNRYVYIWDIGSGKLINKWSAHEDKVSAVILEGNSLWTSSRDRTIKKWDFGNNHFTENPQSELEANRGCALQ